MTSTTVKDGLGFTKQPAKEALVGLCMKELRKV